MSDLYRDLRAKITPEAWAVLEAESRANDKPVSEIVRELLHQHALREIRRLNITHRLLECEGIPGIKGEAG
jgi:hypothetical protein